MALFQSCSDASSLDANIFKSQLKKDTIIKRDTVYINDSIAIIIELLRKKNDSLVTILDSLKIPKKQSSPFTLITYGLYFTHTFLSNDSNASYRTDLWAYNTSSNKAPILLIDSSSNYPKFSFSGLYYYANKQNSNGQDYISTANFSLSSVSILEKRMLTLNELQISYYLNRIINYSNVDNTKAYIYCDNFVIKNDRIYGFDINIESTSISSQTSKQEIKFNTKINIKY